MSATALMDTPSPMPCCAYELGPLYRKGDGSTVCSLCVEIAVLKAQVKGTPFDTTSRAPTPAELTHLKHNHTRNGCPQCDHLRGDDWLDAA